MLALPAITQSGIIETTRKVYDSIGPAFYGLRTTIVTRQPGLKWMTDCIERCSESALPMLAMW
jgi:hypothetical protein